MNQNGTNVSSLLNNGIRRKCTSGGECRRCEQLHDRIEDHLATLTERIDSKTLDNRFGLTIASDFNLWRGLSRPDFFENRITYTADGGRRGWRCELRTVYGDASHGIVVKSVGHDLSKDTAMHESYYNYLMDILTMATIPQMESEQGDATQSSVKENNTIITEDTSVTKSLSYAGQGPRLNLISTEPLHSFDSIMNRWMPLTSHTISTTQAQNAEVFYMNLPEAFYTDTVTPNLTQFRNFLFGEFDIEIRIIVNAHRFQCGKLVACVFPDPIQGLSSRRNFQNALQLPHVIIDLNGNNHGVLEIPFKYRRPVMRLTKDPASNKGVRAGVYASVGMYILAPLRTGADQPIDCLARTFFRFKKNRMAGMSYQVNVQMDDIKGICEGVGMTIKGVEKTLVRAGHLINWDKPQDVTNIIQTVPRPRLNFFTGKGLSDAIQMRMSPYATDILPEQLFRPSDPQTVHDLARIWGYHEVFALNTTDTAGTIVYSWVVDPASSSTNFPPGTDTTGLGVPSPFLFVNGLYNFWSGPIEMRFDFVSNDFITGTIQVAFEPGRMSTTELQGQSTYTKTFHLGEQRSFTFTIPYINDTVMRRTGIETYNEYTQSDSTTGETQDKARGVRMQSVNSITMRVINPLRSVATTTSLIDVLVFIRAGEHYYNLSPVMSSWFVNSTTSAAGLTQFPGSFSVTNTLKSGQLSIPDLYNEVVPTFTNWAEETPKTLRVDDRRPNLLRAIKNSTKFLDPSGKEVEYSVPPAIAKAQMDTGEKEDLDPTMDFSQGVPRNDMVVTDRHDNIIDILRRPVHLWSRVPIGTNSAFSGGGNFTAFYIPVMPPGPMWAPGQAANGQQFLPTVCKTPQASLVSCFRHWRGSLRFTIIIMDSTLPVYVSYLPHNGTLNWGKVDRPRAGPRHTENIGPHSCGLTTEMILPQINPSITVEVPYECEVDYLLTSEEDRSRNYQWREKGLYNNGHIVLWSLDPNEPKAEIWVAAGDSFYLCDFMGTFRTRNRRNPQLPTDNNPANVVETVAKAEAETTKTDFRRANRGSGSKVDPRYFYEVRSQMDTPSTSSKVYELGSKVVASSAFLPGAGFLSSFTGFNIVGPCIGLRAEQVFAAANDKYDSLLGMIKQSISELSSRFHQALDITQLSAIAVDVCMDIIMLIRNFDYASLAITGIKMMAKILGFKPSLVTTAYSRISDWFSKFSKPREQLSGLGEDENIGFIALIAGVVGTMVGVSFEAKDICSWTKTFAKSFTTTKGLSYFNVVFIFVRNFYGVLENMVRTALGKTDPFALQIEGIEINAHQISGLVADIRKHTAELNRNQRMTSLFRFGYWRTYMQAVSLKNMLITLPKKHQSIALLRELDSMIKHADENSTTCASSPIRYVPFVLCLEGAPKIGKSYMVDQLATTFFKSLNLTSKTGNDIFLRNPKSKHWDGFDGQAIVHMDDVFNMIDTESIGVTLSDMFALKTTAQFIPEKAKLEEKGKAENPLCVIQTTNTPFPETLLANVATCVPAILRRRDIVIKANYLPDVDIDQVPLEQLKNFEHLSFQIYGDSTVRGSLGTEHLTWVELEAELKMRIQRYHEKEVLSMRSRLQQAMARMGEHAKLIDPKLDPTSFLSTMDAWASEVRTDTTGSLPSEILEERLPEIAKLLEEWEKTAEVVEEPKPSTSSSEQQNVVLPSDEVQAQAEWKHMVGLLGGLGLVYGGLHAYSALKSMDTGFVTWRCEVCKRATRQYRCRFGHRQCFWCVERTWNTKCLAQLFPEDANLVCGDDHFVAQRPRTESVIAKTLGAGKYIMEGVIERSDFWIAVLAAVGMNWFSDWVCGNTFTFRDINGRLMKISTQGEIRYMGPQPKLGTNQIVDAEVALKRYGIWYDSAAIKKWYDGLQQRKPWFYERTTMPIHQKCKHIPLLDYGDYVRFVGNQWQVVSHGNMVWIPLEKSECIDCQLGFEAYGKIIANWWGQTHEYLYRQLVAASFDVSKILGLIPEFFMHDPYYLEQLVDVSALESPLMKTVKALGMIGAGVGVIYGMYSGLSWMLSVPAKEAARQIEYSGDSITRHFQKAKAKPEVQRLPKVQADELEEVVLGKLMNNACCLKVYYQGGGDVVMSMTGMRERMAILPKHYVTRLRNDEEIIEKIEVGRSADKQSFCAYALDFEDFDVSDTSDISVFHMPKNQMMFKDITGFFQTEDDLTRPFTDKGLLFRLPSTRIQCFTEVPITFGGFKKQVKVAGIDSFIQTDALFYNYSSDGACGSMVLKKNSQRPIVAMHFAGRGQGQAGEGYAIVMTKEMLSDLQPRTQLVERYLPEVVVAPEDSSMLMEAGVQVDYVGEVGKGVFMPKKSKIRPSLIQSEISKIYGTLTRPGFLSRQEPDYPHPHSPLVAGCMKHGKVTTDFKTTELKQAAEFIYDHWLSPMKPVVLNPKKLDLHDVVVGYDGIDGYDPMKLDTSIGYPLNTQGVVSKREDIKVEEHDDGSKSVHISDRVMALYYGDMEKRTQGIVPATIFTAFLKDERRELKKRMKQGSTRIFLMSSVQYTLAKRQHYLHYTAAQMASRHKLYSAVGIRCDSNEWSALVSDLMTVGSNIFTLDYSDFGPAFNSGVNAVCHTNSKKWLLENVEFPSGTEVVLDSFAEEHTNSMHIMLKMIMIQRSGGPSGDPGTVHHNSDVNAMYVCLAWIHIFGKYYQELGLKKSHIWAAFVSNVFFKVYGDDLIASVSDEWKDYFNAKTISEYFGTKGIVSTDASKSKDVLPYATILESTFLKRGFRPHPLHSGEWLAPLDERSIHETCQWIFSSDNPSEATIQNAEASIRAAYGHGIEYFDAHKKVVNKALISVGLQPVPITWQLIDQDFFPFYYK